MKKSYFISILLMFATVPNTSFGILSETPDLDLYKKIDKGLYDLEVKYLEKELKGGDIGGSIATQLNKRAGVHDLGENCFKGNITASDVEKVYAGDIAILDKYIDPSCKNKDGTLPSNFLSSLRDTMDSSYLENLSKAQTKVKNIYEIGKIGMYSDGVDENSPFDLMSDLKEIDKIIFEEEIPYNGVNTFDLGMVNDGILGGLNVNEALGLGGYSDHIMFQGKYKKNNYTDNNGSLVDGNTQVCLTNESGLDAESLSGILSEVKPKQTLTGSKLASELFIPEIGENKSTSAGGYQKVNDNSFWPCNQFFCIIIKFVTYNHNLLGGGNNLSIEGLIKRSNEHMKKAASTSLIQARMTTNLYELNLKDLNLPDMFHVGVQVSYKPVPLLNVEPGGKDKDTDEFKYKNMLTRYYRNLGLDYERANDLHIFKQKEAELKSIIDTAERASIESEERKDNFQSHIESIKKENDFVSNTVINGKVLQEDMQDFFKQFSELESFTRAMMDYAIGAGGVIKKMSEIPTGN